MITKREALVIAFVATASAFGALSAAAGVVGAAFEQLANAFSDGEAHVASVESETERPSMGFTA